MKIKVDQEACTGCMVCVNLCDKCFEMIDGKSSPKKDCQSGDCNLQEVAGSCPVGAIEVEEDTN